MPSVGEIANQAFTNAEVLNARLNELRNHVDGMELFALRERIAVLESQVGELKSHKDDSYKRLWQFLFLAGGAVFAFAGSFAVQWIMNWVKK